VIDWDLAFVSKRTLQTLESEASREELACELLRVINFLSLLNGFRLFSDVYQFESRLFVTRFEV